MFSWLGFGQDEKEQVVEEGNSAQEQVIVEQEPDSVASPNENIVDEVVVKAETQVEDVLPEQEPDKMQTLKTVPPV